MDNALHLLESGAAAHTNTQPVGFALARAGIGCRFDPVLDRSDAALVHKLVAATHLYSGNAVTI